MHAPLRVALAGLSAVLIASAPEGRALAGAGKEDISSVALAFYVGTYTDGESRGIYRFTLDALSGEASEPVLAVEAENPSFLAIHPNGRVLYAVGERDAFGGERTGVVSAFSIDPPNGELTRLNEQPSMGAGPCHLVVDGTGRLVVVANYGGGTVAVLPIDEKGRLGEPSSIQSHSGSGPNRARQERPHPHGVALDAAAARVYVADLGADRIFAYDLDPAARALVPASSVALAPGSGPRHVVFDRSGACLYSINELDSTVTVLRRDPANGRLEGIQTITTLPPGFEGESWTAEVVLSPDGRFLYGSNRGHDSLAVLAVDPATGRLAVVDHVPTGGHWPRHFSIDPTGRWLLVANQRSDAVVVLRLDPASGRPSPTRGRVRVPSPACVLPAP